MMGLVESHSHRSRIYSPYPLPPGFSLRLLFPSLPRPLPRSLFSFPVAYPPPYHAHPLSCRTPSRMCSVRAPALVKVEVESGAATPHAPRFRRRRAMYCDVHAWRATTAQDCSPFHTISVPSRPRPVPVPHYPSLFPSNSHSYPAPPHPTRRTRRVPHPVPPPAYSGLCNAPIARRAYPRVAEPLRSQRVRLLRHRTTWSCLCRLGRRARSFLPVCADSRATHAHVKFVRRPLAHRIEARGMCGRPSRRAACIYESSVGGYAADSSRACPTLGLMPRG
ncbi:hypothetical protein C8F04DRAFT_135931 [Mycena alexandri]|uniref:Uncharacterized protein n=1 Tax=Mycena alexandri TaxID=1745969 RepID=A0AAD6SEV2_9AGAR|nr:hypothetical protein C8F04DRAFT_135931 [Mycena alexandri]